MTTFTGKEGAADYDDIAAVKPEPYPTQEYDDATYALNHPENDAPEPQQSTRTFYRSDYGRAARLIQAARHVPGDVYTAKPEAQQDTVAALAMTFVQVFEADSPLFDEAEFMTATQLPAKYEGSDEEAADQWQAEHDAAIEDYDPPEGDE
jgi:hypothetical protein